MIILGIGSSIDPKEKYIKLAVEHLNSHEKITVKKISKVYKTSAWGGVAKNEFLNICVDIEFYGLAEELLDITQEIEHNLGRVRKEHWGDRTIDIDILLFNEEKIDTERLTIPHKYLTERNFVIYPLVDIVENIEINNNSLYFWKEHVSKEIEIYKDKLL